MDMMDLGRFYGFLQCYRMANWMAIIESGTSNGQLGMGRLEMLGLGAVEREIPVWSYIPEYFVTCVLL
jgi:hypothetical protein